MAQRPSKPRKGASTRGGSKSRSSSGDGFHVPGWLWGLVGIIAGFAAAQYLQSDAPPKRDQVAAVVAKKRTDNGAQQEQNGNDGSQASEEGQMPTFEFYTLLPESEVIAPNVEDYSSPPRPGTEGAVLEHHARQVAGESNSTPSVSNTHSSTSQESTSQKSTSQKSTSSQDSEPSTPSSRQGSASSDDAIQRLASRHEASSSRTSSGQSNSTSSSTSASSPSYMLQAASFKSQSDANAMAGRLRDLGLVTKVTQVKTADNTTWYRVQAGPYQDTGELARARGLMQTRGIEPMQIQQR